MTATDSQPDATMNRGRRSFRYVVTGRRLILLVVFIGVVAAWIVGLGCWPLLVWSPLNCRHEYIDIASGRIRYQRILLGICVHDEITDTEVSLIVQPNGYGPPAVWRVVNTFSPLVHHSPHYACHGAIYQVRRIEQMWNMVPFTPAAKQKIGQDVLFLWQRDGNYFSASQYLSRIELEELIRSRRLDGKVIDLTDLPSFEVVKK